jgi:adenosylcobinamide-GDP ribazoletransferase
VKELFYSLVFSIQFLTRINITSDIHEKPFRMQTALAAFPLVGFLIGCILFCFYKLLTLLCNCNPVTVAVLIVTIETILTGALHLDGLADSCDALLSPHTTTEKKLEIMKDSRIGVMGATALILALLLKITLIAELLGQHLPSILLIYPAVGRWTLVFFLFMSPYLRKSGTGQLLAENTSSIVLLQASAWIIPCVLFPLFIPVFVLHLVALMLYRGYIHKTINGITGDILGSALVLSELIVLLLIVMCR